MTLRNNVRIWDVRAALWKLGWAASQVPALHADGELSGTLLKLLGVTHQTLSRAMARAGAV